MTFDKVFLLCDKKYFKMLKKRIIKERVYVYVYNIYILYMGNMN